MAKAGILAVVKGGTDADIEAAIEQYRGLGSGTMTAIRGGELVSDGPSLRQSILGSFTKITAGNPGDGEFRAVSGTSLTISIKNDDEVDISAILEDLASGDTLHIGSNEFNISSTTADDDGFYTLTGSYGSGSASGTATGQIIREARSSADSVTFAGIEYDDLDFSSDSDLATSAAKLTAGMSGSGVRVSVIDDRFVAVFPWMPDLEQWFDSGGITASFGFNREVASATPGPFIRTRERNLTISFTLTRQPGFPSNGLDLARQAVIDRVRQYGIGEQLWLNDVLAAIEGIGGTRVTNLSIQYDSTDVSGVNPPLDSIWTIGETDITITVA